jgi:hypothetical protein
MNPPAHTAGHLSTPPPASQAPHATRLQPSGDDHSCEVRTGIVLTCGDAGTRSILSKLTCISHLTSDFASEQVACGVAAYNALVPAGITARSHAQVTALFGGLPLVPPGVVPVSEWRPDHAPHGVSGDVYAGLASTGRPR